MSTGRIRCGAALFGDRFSNGILETVGSDTTSSINFLSGKEVNVGGAFGGTFGCVEGLVSGAVFGGMAGLFGIAMCWSPMEPIACLFGSAGKFGLKTGRAGLGGGEAGM